MLAQSASRAVLPVFVDEGVEGHPVPPAGGEVVDVDVWISGQEEEVNSSSRSRVGPKLKINGADGKRSVKSVVWILTLPSSSDTRAAERL